MEPLPTLEQLRLETRATLIEEFDDLIKLLDTVPEFTGTSKQVQEAQQVWADRAAELRAIIEASLQKARREGKCLETRKAHLANRYQNAWRWLLYEPALDWIRKRHRSLDNILKRATEERRWSRKNWPD